MKVRLLILVMILASYGSYAQNISWDAETFNYQNNTVSQYGLGWYHDSDAPSGPMAYLSAYGGVKFFTGGVFRGVLNINGNLGIGTASPDKLLTVAGQIGIYGNSVGVNFKNTASANKVWDISPQGNDLYFNETGLETALMLKAGGNVGIGTVSPDKLLTVAGQIGVYGNAVGVIFKNTASANKVWDISSQGSDLYFNETGLQTGLMLKAGGNIGIGTTNPDSKLAVNGTIHSKEVKVDLTGWADYVFKPEYQLPSLSEVKTYVDQNHHLPEIPSEQDIAKDGLNLGEMNRILVKKVEELTLYMMEKDKQVNSLQYQVDDLRRQLNELTKR